MKSFSAYLLVLFVFLYSVPICPAQNAQNDWNSIRNHLNREIAVKTKTGTTFGILRSADDDRLGIQPAGKKNLSNTESSFNRAEIEKIWNAELRFGGRNIGKGALIGAGAGAAIGLVTAVNEKEDGQAGVAVPFYALYGAAIGGFAGFFAKKSHRKGKLIYRQ